MALEFYQARSFERGLGMYSVKQKHIFSYFNADSRYDSHSSSWDLCASPRRSQDPKLGILLPHFAKSSKCSSPTKPSSDNIVIVAFSNWTYLNSSVRFPNTQIILTEGRKSPKEGLLSMTIQALRVPPARPAAPALSVHEAEASFGLSGHFCEHPVLEATTVVKMPQAAAGVVAGSVFTGFLC